MSFEFTMGLAGGAVAMSTLMSAWVLIVINAKLIAVLNYLQSINLDTTHMRRILEGDEVAPNRTFHSFGDKTG